MKWLLSILVTFLAGATGGFYGDRYFAVRPVPSAVASPGAKPVFGHLHVYRLDDVYALDCRGMLTVRQPDGTDARREMKIHLEASDDEQPVNDLISKGDATFANVKGFVTDDAEDSQ